MKLGIGVRLACLVVAWFAARAPAQQLIVAWDFNHPTDTNHPAPSVGEGTVALLGGVTASFASGTGSSDPATSGDLAWSVTSFPGQGKSPRTAGVEFRASTTGWRDIAMRFDLRPSNTAARTVAAQYTVDGATFLDAAVLTLSTGGAFTNGLIVDLSNVTDVADNPNFAVRLVSAFPTETDAGYAAVSGSYSSAGTWRFDAVQLLGRSLSGGDPVIGLPPVLVFTNVLSQLARPGDAPTNRYTELAVRPGEHLAIEVLATSPDGTPFVLETRASADLPTDAGWAGETTGEAPAEARRVRFDFHPPPAAEGQRFDAAVIARNPGATNVVQWRLYVPTVDEQGIVLTEFLANPSATAGHPLFDPLHRDPPSDKPTQHDEYVELVNFGKKTVELGGWQLGDSAAVRHVFPESTAMGVAATLIVYGGPRGGPPVGVEGLAQPVSEGISGLSLNNDGDTLVLRNAASNLVWRVVYAAGAVSATGALGRWPDRDGPFVPQGTETSPAVTPGRRRDGTPFTEADTRTETDPPGDDLRLTVVRTGDDTLELRWAARTGQVYRVWASSTVGSVAGFLSVATGLHFDDAQGRFVLPAGARGETRFYRVSTP